MVFISAVTAQETATYNRGNSNYFAQGGAQIRYARGTCNLNTTASGKIVTGLAYIYACKVFNVTTGTKDVAWTPNGDGAGGTEAGSIGINAVTTNTDLLEWFAIGRAV